jgi:hypothetical protein
MQADMSREGELRPDQLMSAPGSWRVQTLRRPPTTCIIMRPAGVVVSMFSVMERKPAPVLETSY